MDISFMNLKLLQFFNDLINNEIRYLRVKKGNYRNQLIVYIIHRL